MAWIKIPPEHHPLFRSSLPTDKRISTVNMFGGVAAKVKGRMFAGLFARTAIVKLSPADQKEGDIAGKEKAGEEAGCEEEAHEETLGHSRIRMKMRMTYQNISATEENSASAAATYCCGS